MVYSSMRIKESGMPDENLWESFFEPEKILTTMQLNSSTRDTFEFGCGYGTFTIPVSKAIKGKIMQQISKRDDKPSCSKST